VALRLADVLDAVAALPETWQEHHVRRRVGEVELRRHVTRRGSAIVFSVEEVGGVPRVLVRYVTHGRRRLQYPAPRDVRPWSETERVNAPE
jgi:hypothetical protein